MQLRRTTEPTPTSEPDSVAGAPESPPDNQARTRALLWRSLPVAALVCAGLMFANLTPEAIGVLGLVLMFLLMLIKLPIGVAMAVPGIIGTWSIVGWRSAHGIMSRMPFEVVASWSMTILPMFVFMGMLLWRSGLTENIYTVARQWFGWLPGGLAIGTNLAGAGMATVIGSTVGSTYALTRAGVPEMIKAGYDRRLTLGAVLSGGALAHLIPPSVLMVIYAGISETPVGPQLMAGLGPGILLSVLFAAMFIVLGIVKPNMVGAHQARLQATWNERIRGLGSIWTAPVLIVAIVGGMFSGIFTPTEAGAVGAFAALLVTAWMCRNTGVFAPIRDAATATLSSVAAIFFLMIGAHILTRFLSVSGLVDNFVAMVADLGLSRVEFLALMIVVYLVLGMIMDSLAMMLVVVPILLPVITGMGISPIWFGVFTVIFCELAVITPPVGILAFIVSGIVKDRAVNVGTRISLGDVFTGALWILPVPLVLVVLLIAFPDIALWLPDQMGEQ